MPAPRRQGPYQFCAPHPRNRACVTKVWPDNDHDHNEDGSYKNQNMGQKISDHYFILD